MPLLDQVKSKVKDDSGRLTDGDDYLPAIDAALERYGKHLTRELVKDVPGGGSHDVELPAEWVEEFSRVVRVEYPVDEVPAVLLDADRWHIYQAPAGPVLRLLDEEPLETESVRLTITVPRAEANILQGDLDAVASLAASYCCETLANLFAQSSDPTIAADAVNYRSKSGEFSRRAKRLSELYHQHLGIDPEGPAPAAAVVAQAPAPVRGRLTH